MNNSFAEIPRERNKNLPMEVWNVITTPSIPTHQIANDIQPCNVENYLALNGSNCKINDDSHNGS